ncbi:uncharacterized protein LOC127720410 [Mytilus californianus]|uniref:uncharacterized protein LOC127720410 n=1 Tax=Mytilus californianus TaxID=6549 RepID=UPI0022450DFB|nr:uncharacterized protein LOC127720410 [Mytilus californianus]XP_052082946.1 uncharacterized protein LOC127720410 [Mytilus californianus]
MQLTIKNLEEKKLQNARKQKQMEDIKKYASDLQTFLGLRHLSSEVLEDVASLQLLLENESLDKVEIAFELDKNITSICNSINTFGSVQLRKIPCSIRLENQKGKQAQTIEKRSSIENIVVKFIDTLQVNTRGDTISGCDFLPDGKMVFSIYSLNIRDKDIIVVFTPNGTHLDNVSLDQNYAFDVVSLDDKTVAVTSPTPGGLCFMSVDIYRKRLTKTKTNFSCYSITFSDGKLLTNACGRGIISIDATNGNILSTIKRDLPTAASLALFKSKLYFCDPEKNTISCSDMEGNSIWTFKDDRVIKNPSGIAVDGMGNVYVTNQDLNNVIIVSSDGFQSKQLLSQSDGLKNPKAIQYDRKRNLLLVANKKKEAFLFDISH